MQPCTISITSHGAINTPLCWPDRRQIFDAAKVCNSIRGFLCRYGGFGTRVPSSAHRAVWEEYTSKYTHTHTHIQQRAGEKEEEEKKKGKIEEMMVLYHPDEMFTVLISVIG